MGQTNNIHPGEILKEEFLQPMNISAYKLANRIGVQQTRISQIIKGTRSITADTSIRLAKFFGTTEAFWLNLQREYDLRKAKEEKGKEFESIEKFEFAG
ncbi:MAG: HigA family addiction module antitoxin [Cyclobacteriaceae bacterium]